MVLIIQKEVLGRWEDAITVEAYPLNSPSWSPQSVEDLAQEIAKAQGLRTRLLEVENLTIYNP